MRLLNRTTRSISLTAEGETYLVNARRILGEIEEMERQVSSSPPPSPRACYPGQCTAGFRSYACGAGSVAARQTLPRGGGSVAPHRPPHRPAERCHRCGYPLGELPDSRLIARKIAANRRRLCAAPAYLAAHGTPEAPKDLASHNCIVLRQNDAAFGIWRLSRGKQSESVKVRGSLSTNDGEVALNWALDGQGILMRAEWNLADHLRSGRLVEVLGDYQTPPADIYAVYLERLNLSAKVSCFVEHLRTFFRQGETLAAWQ